MDRHAWTKQFTLFCCLLTSHGMIAQSATFSDHFDWQGHRGCRGLMPENTVPAFIEALRYPVTTLELDVVVSADSQIIVSHEPWMNPEICLDPGGAEISGDGRQHNLFSMTAAEIRSFDCGTKYFGDFPGQTHLRTHKPTLTEVVASVKKHCTEHDRALPRFNIELKSHPAGYDVFVPRPATFVALVVEALRSLGIAGSTTLQSFDVQVLREIHARHAGEISISYLTSNVRKVDVAIAELGYVPEVYSCHYRLVSKKLVGDAHARGMLVIPWTINKDRVARRLIRRGVDGIITDFPDRIPLWTEYF